MPKKTGMEKSFSTKPHSDGTPLFNKRHSDYCGLCKKNTPCPHYDFRTPKKTQDHLKELYKDTNLTKLTKPNMEKGIGTTIVVAFATAFLTAFITVYLFIPKPEVIKITHPEAIGLKEGTTEVTATQLWQIYIAGQEAAYERSLK